MAFKDDKIFNMDFHVHQVLQSHLQSEAAIYQLGEIQSLYFEKLPAWRRSRQLQILDFLCCNDRHSVPRFSPESHQEHPARQQSLTTVTLLSPCSPATHTQDNLSFHYRTVLALAPPMAESSLFLSLSLSFILLRQQILSFLNHPCHLLIPSWTLTLRSHNHSGQGADTQLAHRPTPYPLLKVTGLQIPPEPGIRTPSGFSHAHAFIETSS